MIQRVTFTLLRRIAVPSTKFNCIIQARQNFRPIPINYLFSKHKSSDDEAHHNHHQPQSHKKQSEQQSHNKQEHQHQPHKLSKMSFEELIQLNIPQSLKYANMIVEQESKAEKEKQKEIEELKKSIQFFTKHDKQIHQKEILLNQHVKNYEEEAELSKKRAEREISDSKHFAITKIAKELVEVADSVKMCVKYADEHRKNTQDDEFLSHIVESQKKMKEVLKHHQIQQFDPIGQEYDPNTSESMVEIPAVPNTKPNQVAYTMRTGYLINGRLLRSARVGVFS